jgi:hypothetical protein
LRARIAGVERDRHPASAAGEDEARRRVELGVEIVEGAIAERAVGDLAGRGLPVGMPRASSTARRRTGTAICQSARATSGSER